MFVSRRALLAFAAVTPAAVLAARSALAVEALPDSRFVGYVQHVNDFEIASGQMALAKSANENVRTFASRMIAAHTEAASFMAKARQEAGVSYAPDPGERPHTRVLLDRLSALEGPDFDFEYGRSQFIVFTEAEAQYGAYSQNGKSGPLRQYAIRDLPNIKRHLEFSVRLPGAR